MSTVQITTENFVDTVKQGGIVILDWWASWCGPCRAFSPIFERVAAENPDIVFGKINTEEEPALAQQYKINSIPTLMVIRDRVLLYAEPGMLPEKALNTLIEEVKKLDMDAILHGAPTETEQAALA